MFLTKPLNGSYIMTSQEFIVHLMCEGKQAQLSFSDYMEDLSKESINRENI